MSASTARNLAPDAARDLAPLRVLIAAQDSQIRSSVSRHLIKTWPLATVTASNDAGSDLEDRWETLSGYDLLVIGVRLRGQDPVALRRSLAWLRQLRDRGLQAPVVLIGDAGHDEVAAEALRAGASDYLPRYLLTRESFVARARELLGDDGETGIRRRQARQIATHLGITPYGYELQDCLDQNGRRAVFLAASRELRQQVVLKVLVAEEGALSLDPEFQRLTREFALIAYFDHPAIASIYEFKASREYCFIAMEYFSRGDLRARLRSGVSLADRLRYLRSMLAALDLLHGAGVLHRDLKPSNVMLREDDSIALIDFGLARTLHDPTGMTIAGEIRGTPYYMSPEQAGGHEVDLRSDLYSLGAMAYEMLEGRKLYRGATPAEILDQHMNAPVPSLVGEAATLEPWVHRLLEKSPDARYQNAAEALDALSVLSAGL